MRRTSLLCCAVNIVISANIRYFQIIHCTGKIARTVIDQVQMSESDIVQKLLAALQELPRVRSEPPVFEGRSTDSGGRFDAEIDLKVADERFSLLVEVKKSIYPRDVREILWNIGR